MDTRELLTVSKHNPDTKYLDYEIKYINLKYCTCDDRLLDESDLKQYIDLEFIPWKKHEGDVFIATTHVTDKLLRFLRNKYTCNFKVYICSKRSLVLAVQRNFSAKLLNKTINNLRERNEKFSAHYVFNKKTKTLLFSLGIIFLSMLFFRKEDTVYTLFILANCIFLINSLFKVVLFWSSKQENLSPDSGALQEIKNMPSYCVLVPLFKEDHSLPNLINSLKNIKYPRDKLEVIFIVEQFDRRTISFLKKQKERFFEIVCVPKGGPKTKPKACSYVLNYIKSEYLVIYDAEDKPEPYQLLKAASTFKTGDKKLACLQGRLNFYNSSENILTSFFAIEYFCWFNIFLKGLLNLGMPIPLGGSSNHFKVDILKKVGGWDPYNVTEDADLGYRFFKSGYKVGVLDSLTLEEAPHTIYSWLNQRTRWIKGHLQTYFVHLRTNSLLKKNIGKQGVLGFHLFLFFPIISYILNFFVLFMMFYQKSTFSFLAYLNYFLWLAVSSFLAFYSFRNCKQKISLKSVFLYYSYYFLHSIASVCALYKIIAKPHYWEKTEHDFFKRFKLKAKKVGT